MTKENSGELLNKNRKSQSTQSVRPEEEACFKVFFFFFVPGCILYLLTVTGRAGFSVNRFPYDGREGKLPPK